MSTPLEPALLDELRTAVDKGLAAGELPIPGRIDEQTALFRARFGPELLAGLDGEDLLRILHGRESADARCLAYWLEFKNDDEFAGHIFGAITGGSALKFGIFQRQADMAWITGSPQAQKVLTNAEAVAIARQHRNELVAGAKVLHAFDAGDPTDLAYAALQEEMQRAAPTLHDSSWAHKYWFLLYPDTIDGYHTPHYQRFHLYKLLQQPPDRKGVLHSGGGRFICAGRFVAAARELGVPQTTLGRLLNRRDGALHRYWKVGTTEGSQGRSLWPEMRDGGFVSIGWKDAVPDLSVLPYKDKAANKQHIGAWLLPSYSDVGTATRKAGEILNFCQEIAERDLVLACEGQTVLGVGRVRGAYYYDANREFPHSLPVDWLTLDAWTMPESEAPRTTVFEMGRYAANLLELERRLFRVRHNGQPAAVLPAAPHSAPPPMPPLDPLLARVESILRRKGQVILYGPPGTGKTHTALAAANELAARHAFRRRFADLPPSEQQLVSGTGGMVRLCTFHPGWGYEDFVEGLRPRSADGQLLFEPRDGVFKTLCIDAAQRPGQAFFLVVDEINRGDLPRIFGELLTVLEYDKRERQVVLPVTGEAFAVPANVFLIGTMNTADRSISLLDAALRRRFGFVELMPDSSLLAGRRVGGLSLAAWLDALNTRLRAHLKRDARNLQIGHAYLMPRQPIVSVAEFARVLRDDIVPLLGEYCYDDFTLLRDILGTVLVDADAGRIREEMFEEGRGEELILALRFEELQLVSDRDPFDDAPRETTDDAEAADDATA